MNVLLALTQEACDRYARELEPGGILIVDTGAVAVPDGAGAACHALPITATAMRVLGTPVGANLVALGALVRLCGVVPAGAIEQVLGARRPGGSAERALLALRAGMELAAPR